MRRVSGFCAWLRTITFLLMLLPIGVFFLPAMSEAFNDDIEGDVQKNLSRSKVLIEQIKTKLSQGASVTTDLKQLKTISENIEISNLLIEERFKLREEKVKALGSKALERHQNMVEGYRKALTEYLGLVDSLLADPQPATRNTQQLLDLLNKLLPKKKRPIIGSLPYKHLNYPAIEPSTSPTITPAYQGGNKTVTPDDTKTTDEAPISNEIATLAQSLTWNPVSIYEYVKNNIETEWYWGCMKGAEETLHQKSGNDCDQATLLTALLRASGFPTRYVRGTIEFTAAAKDLPINRIKNLTGIDDPNKIAEFFQKAGIPYTPVIAGGAMSNFQIEHIWVESFIPYANYRGAIMDDLGKTWLGLDTSIKVKGYAYQKTADGAWPMADSVWQRISSVRDEYLGLGLNSQPTTTQPATPLEYLRSAINAELRTQNSQLLYADFLRTRTLTPEVMNILPAGMQFKEIKTTNEYMAIPDELLHKVRFLATNPQLTTNNELLSVTRPLYQLANRQIAVNYEPESVEDQEIIDTYGGLGYTPAYLVRLRPVLEINGERTVVANDGLPMGGKYDLTIELTGASGVQSSGKATNTQIIGNQVVIGIVGQKANVDGLTTNPTGKDAKQLTFEETQRYIDRWNQAEDELASFLHLALARPLPAITIIGGLIDVTYLLDIPQGVSWKGVFVDAAFRSIEAVSNQQTTSSGQLTADSSERVKLFMQLSSLQGSILENRILEDDFQVESISTAKLFQLATSNTGSTTSMLSIDKTNINAILPTLSVDDNIKEDIRDAVNQNFAIRIPQSEMTYKDWTGIGYLKENPSTGESGWMLTGMIAGAMNALSPEQWVNMYLAAVFTNPLNVAPNGDPLSATSIRKIPSADEQRGIVDGQLPNPLAVFVADSKGKPVKGATVAFRVIAGAAKIQCLNPVDPAAPAADECQGTTGHNGLAKATLTLGKLTDANPTYLKLNDSDEFYTKVGLNLVTVAVAAYSGSIPAVAPFNAYGMPDVPAQMSKTFGDGATAIVNNPAGSLSVIVQDKHGNPVSNVNVKYTSGQATSMNPSATFPTESQGLRKIVFYKRSECSVSYPLYGDCPTYTTVTIKTDSYGALIDTIMGNTVESKYTVEAAVQDLPTGAPAVNPATFTMYSDGHREGDGYIPTYLSLKSLYLVNDKGQPINASKAGTLLKAPLAARLVRITDTLIMQPQGACTDGSQEPCWRTTSNGVINFAAVSNGNIAFAAKTGGGATGQTTNEGSGKYQAKYTTGPVPMKNTVEVFGTASLDAPEMLLSSYGTLIEVNYHTDTLTMRHDVIVPTGTYAAFDKDTKELRPYITSSKPIYTVYGIDVSLKIEPTIILLGDEGYTTGDTTLTYTILPDGTGSTDPDAAYRASTVDIDFFKNAGTSTDDTWSGYMVGDNLQGQGTDILTMGSYFDVNVQNKAQVVLNRGTDAEVRGEKKQIPVAQINVLTDEGSDSTKVDEIKFGDGSNAKKKKRYRIELTSKSQSQSCGSITGTIKSVLSSGQTVTALGADYYPVQYDLTFSSSGTGCSVKIGGKDKFIVSNRSTADLNQLGTVSSDTAVLYGGIGSKVVVEVSGAKKEIPIEPVGVIVLGIDGLRQDVLYTSGTSGEASYNDPTGCGVQSCFTDLYNVKGICAVMGGKYDNGLFSTSCDPTGAENKHIKLPNVTAIFPSVTLASWASIFSGKMPVDTGIPGNEFFARDLENYHVPPKFNNPAGMITFDGGAFQGYSEYGFWDKANDTQFIVPYSSSWDVLVEPTAIPQNQRPLLKADTVYEQILGRPTIEGLPDQPGFEGVIKYFKDKGGDPVVVAYSHYARGARWLTHGIMEAIPVTNPFDVAKLQSVAIDKASWSRFDDYLKGEYYETMVNGDTTEIKRNRTPFSALTVWYLPGLDHLAHGNGMGAYRDYFINNTDSYVKQVVDTLKGLDEFDNKIFIIVADHGHTAMPTDLTYVPSSSELGVPESAEMSCSLRVTGFNRDDIQEAEKANNNLHIWELANLFTQFPSSVAGVSLKILAPKEIANLTDITSATSDIATANIIAALNGPMAHIYIKGTDWQSDPDPQIMNLVLNRLYFYLKTGVTAIGSDKQILSQHFPRLMNSIGDILVRKRTQTPTGIDDTYEVVTSISEDASGNLNIATATLTSSIGDVDSVNRISKMNSFNRSGDIVLIMKDTTTGNAIDRYTTGVACKSWHGSLNSSDSYVPFILSYPGGNKNELSAITDVICANDGCNGNWSMPELIKGIINKQY